MPKTRKLKGRSHLARAAHLRSGAGAMGGSRKQQIRRKRRDDRDQERRVAREPAATE
jgi:hypothetical protein